MDVPLLKSIGAKLFALMAIAMLATISAISLQNHQLFRNYLDRQIADGLIDQARESANGIEATVKSWVGQVAVVVQSFSMQPQSQWQPLAGGLLASNREFLSFDVITADGLKTMVSAFTRTAEREHRFESRSQNGVAEAIQVAIKAWLPTLPTDDGNERKAYLRNLSSQAGVAIVGLAIRFKATDQASPYWAVLTAWQSELAGALPSNDSVRSFLIARSNAVLASPLTAFATQAATLRETPLTRAAKASRFPFGFLSFRGKEGANLLGSYCYLRDLDLYIVLEKDGRQVYDLTERLIRRTALWALMFMLGAILVSYVVSSSMTRNIRLIARATKDIATGGGVAPIKIAARDELGWLGTAVNHMAGEIQRLLEETAEKARMATELATAQMVQEAFLPSRTIEAGPLRIVAENRMASECGGDWWGHTSLGNGRELVTIADATGHGASAALITAVGYTCHLALAPRGTDDAVGACESMLHRMNEILFQAGKGTLTMTLVAALFDSQDGTVTVFNCGHNFPVLLAATDRGEAQAKPLSGGGFLLGLDQSIKVRAKRHSLMPGNCLVMYTDGLIECRSPAGEQFGGARLKQVLRGGAGNSATSIKDALMREMEAHCATTALRDDVTVIVVETTRDFAIEKPSRPDAA